MVRAGAEVVFGHVAVVAEKPNKGREATAFEPERELFSDLAGGPAVGIPAATDVVERQELRGCLSTAATLPSVRQDRFLPSLAEASGKPGVLVLLPTRPATREESGFRPSGSLPELGGQREGLPTARTRLRLAWLERGLRVGHRRPSSRESSGGSSTHRASGIERVLGVSIDENREGVRYTNTERRLYHGPEVPRWGMGPRRPHTGASPQYSSEKSGGVERWPGRFHELGAYVCVSAFSAE